MTWMGAPARGQAVTVVRLMMSKPPYGAVPSLVSSKPSDGGAKCAPARGARAREINPRRETGGRALAFGLRWLIIWHVQGSPHQGAIVFWRGKSSRRYVSIMGRENVEFLRRQTQRLRRLPASGGTQPHRRTRRHALHI